MIEDNSLASGIFLSTLSLRRATCSFSRPPPAAAYFYPRSPCGERLHEPNPYHGHNNISIHALLAESDVRPFSVFVITIVYFYPRSPCGERRSAQFVGADSGYFYPRSPCGERRCTVIMERIETIFLSTLSLRRATPKSILHQSSKLISIHALLAESDGGQSCNSTLVQIFLSTLSLRRATAINGRNPDVEGISIHALLAESDLGRVEVV